MIDDKWAGSSTGTHFQPVAVESLDPTHDSARQFLDDLGRRITCNSRSGNDRESSFFCFSAFQFLLHRFNYSFSFVAWQFLFLFPPGCHFIQFYLSLGNFWGTFGIIQRFKSRYFRIWNFGGVSQVMGITPFPSLPPLFLSYHFLLRLCSSSHLQFPSLPLEVETLKSS